MDIKHYRKALPTLVAALSGALTGAGIPTALAAAEDERIANIVVTEIIPANPGNTPGAAYRLGAEELEELRPYTLHDAFDFIPGVRTIDDDVLGRRSAIGIRGAPSRRSRKTLMLEDGVPINFSTYLDPSSHYTPPMERLESVDVLKGAGHVLQGPLNNHGIVNFRNKPATSSPETVVELSAGNLDLNKRHLLHRRTQNGVGLVLSYTGADAGGAFDVEDFSYDDVFASASWQVAEAHALDLSLTWFRERSHYDESNLTPQEYAVAPRTKLGRFGQEYNTFALDYRKLDLNHEYRISDNLSMSNRVFAIDADRPRFTTEPEDILVDALPAIVHEDPETEFIAGVQGEMISRDRHYRNLGAESRMALEGLQAWGMEHELQWGLRVERQLLSDRRSVGEPGEILKESNRGSLTRDDAYRAQAASLFFQDQMRFGDFLLTPGLRAEYYSQSKAARALPLDPGPDGPKETEHVSLLLPSLSVLYLGLDNTEMFANLARGYTPAFARTAESFPLHPETGINSQIGLRTDVHPALGIEAAVFYNWIEDTIVQLPYSVEDMNVVLNSADSRSYGLDLGLRLDSAPLALHGEAFNAFAELAYSYTRAEFREDPFNTGIDGNRVPEIPLHAGSLTLGLEHATGWHASLSLSHFGEFYTDPQNTVELTLADEDREPVKAGDELEIREPAVLGRVPSHTLVSARVGYRFSEQLSFWLQGRNLGDKLYITDLENGIRPGAERSWVAGLRLRF